MKQEKSAAEASSRLKRAELTSSLGAGLLGFWLGAMAASYITDLAQFVVIAGALMHGWGMYDKHTIERGLGRPEAIWMKVLYWSCWLLLAGLAAVLAFRILS